LTDDARRAAFLRQWQNVIAVAGGRWCMWRSMPRLAAGSRQPESYHVVGRATDRLPRPPSESPWGTVSGQLMRFGLVGDARALRFGLTVTVLTAVFGILVSAISGYLGLVHAVVMRITDAMQRFRRTGVVFGRSGAAIDRSAAHAAYVFFARWDLIR
jgi:hypothetical protein